MDDEERRLHDRATRGDLLSDEERVRLELCYARLDREEELATSVNPQQVETSENLRAEIKSAVERLQSVVSRIQAVAAANEDLRTHIADLEHQVSKRFADQPA